MPQLEPITSEQVFPVGTNQSQTQPYVPAQRTIAISQLPDNITPDPQDMFAIQQNGTTNKITLGHLSAYIGGSPVDSVNGLIGDVLIGVFNLTDTVISNPQQNDFLIYSNGKWRNSSVAATVVTSWNGLTGAVSAGIGDLNNVTIVTPANNQVLVYSFIKSKWENKYLGDFFPDITDSNGLITVTGPAGLRVNNATNTYGSVTFHNFRPTLTNFTPTTNQSAVAVMADLKALTINGLSNVSMTSPVPNSNIISWNTLAGKWVNIDYDPTKNVPSMLWTPSSVTTGSFSSATLTYDKLTGIVASNDGNGLYYTQDAKAVYQSNISTGSYYQVVQFKGNVYAIGTGGVEVSADGATWVDTSITSPDGINLLTDNSILISLYTGASTLGVYTTTDGVTWTHAITTGVYEVGDYKPDSDTANNVWLIGGVDVVSYSLDDGVTWQTETVTFDVTAIEYAFGETFLVSTTTGLYEAVIDDTPSISFNLLTTGNFTDVIFDAGIILALRADNVPMWSTDAINFYDTTGSSPVAPLTTVAFGNGYWTAGGVDTGLWWSIDAKEWALSNQIAGTLNHAIYGGTAWLALMGDNGGILWSNNTAGKVISVNGQTGIVEIGLNNLRGTRIINPQDGDFLIYRNNLWENRNIVDITDITVHNLTVTELATIHDMVVITASFNSLADFNGGLESTTANFTGQVTGVNADFTGDLITAQLGVTGLSTFGGLLSANGGASVNGSFSVSGSSVLGGLSANTPTFSGVITGVNSPTGLTVSNSIGNGFRLYNTTSGTTTLGTLRYATTAAPVLDLVFDGALGTISYNGSELVNLTDLSAYTPTSTLNSLLALKANLASPALTGVPTAPTAPPGTNTTQIASTQYVMAAITAGGAYPNLTSSGTGVNTLLTYAGTQGLTLTAGPLNVNSVTPSQFLYRPRVTTPAVNNTSTTYFALIGDITAGTLLDASFKTVRSAGVTNTSTLLVSSTMNVSGLSTLNGLTANSPTFTGAVVVNQPLNATPAMILNNTISNGFQFFPVSGSNTNLGTLRYLATGSIRIDLQFDGLSASILYKGSELAHLTSPVFSGVPTAPTAAVNTNNNQIATTAYTVAEINQFLNTYSGYVGQNAVTGDRGSTLRFWATQSRNSLSLAVSGVVVSQAGVSTGETFSTAQFIKSPFTQAVLGLGGGYQPITARSGTIVDVATVDTLSGNTINIVIGGANTNVCFTILLQLL